MPAIWTPPVTWAVNQLVTAEDMNEQIRDNLEWLKSPPLVETDPYSGSDYTTTSTSWVTISGSDLGLWLEVTGGPVLVGFTGMAAVTAGQVLYFDVYVGSESVSGNDGIASVETRDSVSFVWLVPEVAAGNRLFRLFWRVNGGTGRLYNGGTSNHRYHPQLWVREI